MKYYPTQRSGRFIGYQAEFKDSQGEWQRCKEPPEGVTLYPKEFKGILSTIHFYGYAQANAMCWSYKMSLENIGIKSETRVVAYDITYDIKAKRME